MLNNSYYSFSQRCSSTSRLERFCEAFFENSSSSCDKSVCWNPCTLLPLLVLGFFVSCGVEVAMEEGKGLFRLKGVDNLSFPLGARLRENSFLLASVEKRL